MEQARQVLNEAREAASRHESEAHRCYDRLRTTNIVSSSVSGLALLIMLVSTLDQRYGPAYASLLVACTCRIMGDRQSDMLADRLSDERVTARRWRHLARKADRWEQLEDKGCFVLPEMTERILQTYDALRARL